MCIALLVKPEANVTDEVLKTCYTNNSDGCGFAYIKDGQKIDIKKTMYFNEFLWLYKEAKAKSPTSPFLVHFRIATHGTVDEFNCHPFFIDERTAFIHNGIIHEVRKDQKMSDTQVFNEDILKRLPEGWAFNIAMKPLIEKFIGFSKLAVLSVDGSWDIYNESKGEWKDNVWFSNGTYKPSGWRKPSTTYYPATIPAVKGKIFEDDVSVADHSLMLDINVDWEQCNNCGDWHPIKEMRAYNSYNKTDLYCADCEETLLVTEFLDVRDSSLISVYIKDHNQRVAASSDSFMNGGLC